MTDPNKQQLDMYKSAAAEQGLEARRVALDLIDAVLRHKRTLDEALESHTGLDKLAPRDRAFTRMLAATILRRLGQIDDLAAKVLDRPLERVTPRKVLDVIRLGIVQIGFLETPPHAAVDTSVRLAAQMGMEKQKGLVNAVLRNFTKKAQDLIAVQDEERLNVPDWLWFTWVKQYGVELTLKIAQANLQEASLDITVKDSATEWAQRLDAAILPTGTLRREPGGQVTQLPGYQDGVWWIQDASSALPARLFGDVQGKTIVDLCAAPGGKSAQLAHAGANVIALDRAARRMKRLQENFERLHLPPIQCEVSDATAWKPAELVDGVLVDAPCTATGTIRRHPDLLHLKTPEDVTHLTTTQAQMLENAVNMLKPGGILIFCTCSLQYDEGERQIDMLLRKNARIRRVPITPGEVGGVEDIINDRGEVRALPFHLGAQGGMDGFFIARLEKTG